MDSYRIMAHRGLVSSAAEENSLDALLGALRAGLSVELDIRDQDGEICISHDPPLAGKSLRLVEFLELALEILPLGSRQRIALNVKSDGLAKMLVPMKDLLLTETVFFFDMSVPQVSTYWKSHVPVALRVSELEDPGLISGLFGNRPAPLLFWCDSLGNDPQRIMKKWEGFGGQRFIVSPELHGHEVEPVWRWFRSQVVSGADLFLCTDLVTEAQAFFDADGDSSESEFVRSVGQVR